ncbi:hypothetical protein CYMTET_17592 [Cymbomonas tetramitiformis]|uniref:Nitroreductase domain-containing protein n=1 Tax=Cymbomonas tetramitiformis TaxID=36881 RepID=A0AAE0GA99_9CHLO|nr:hypothetical protein CYMTET_17592 [Cymbomonas tetramitiformis]
MRHDCTRRKYDSPTYLTRSQGALQRIGVAQRRSLQPFHTTSLPRRRFFHGLGSRKEKRLRVKASDKDTPTESTPDSTVLADDSQAFERVVRSRYSSKHFSTKSIPEGMLQKCLALASRGPTGFNVQPYVAIVVDSKDKKEAVSAAMLGPNAQRVLDAPATIVFAADNNCDRLLPKVTQALRDEGAPESYVSKVPLYVRLFSGGFGYFAGIPVIRMLLNLIGFLVRKVAFKIVSYFMPVPTPSTAETWSFKQSIFPATIFMLACTAFGLATCPMEGYDTRRLRNALELPNNYSIPVAFAVGYPESEVKHRSSRFPPQELFFHNSFGTPYPGVPAV